MTIQRPTEDTARLGKEIYERDIRRKVEADHEERSSRLTSTLVVGPLPTTFWQRQTVCAPAPECFQHFGVNGLWVQGIGQLWEAHPCGGLSVQGE